MNILEVEKLKVRYGVRESMFKKEKFVRAVDGVTFSVKKGEILGLVGESGCGKSTLGRAIVRLEKPYAGRICFGDLDMANLRGRKLRHARKDFQMIFQDPYASLNPRMSIAAMFDEIIALHHRHLSRAERRERSVRLLEIVGMKSEHLDRYAHQFSGGQRQRIGIARALAVEPKLIIADEPVSALDVSVQAQIINLLAEIRRKTNTAFLFIAHDLAVVEHICDRIMVMYLGKIVEQSDSRQLCSNPRHPYTRALLSAVPQIDPATRRRRIILPGDVPSPLDPPAGCPFHPRCPKVQDVCRQKVPELEVMGESATSCACFFPESREK